MRNITLKQLRALSAIGQSKKIVSAAKELRLTPPAITLQLQQLEAEAGFVLFDRTSDGPASDRRRRTSCWRRRRRSPHSSPTAKTVSRRCSGVDGGADFGRRRQHGEILLARA